MHEVQVAREIIDIVEREMAKHALTRVNTVSIRIGPLSCINADALQFVFEAATAETDLAGVCLNVEKVPVMARCKSCGGESQIDLPIFACPLCSGADIDIIRGEELHVEYIIGE